MKSMKKWFSLLLTAAILTTGLILPASGAESTASLEKRLLQLKDGEAIVDERVYFEYTPDDYIESVPAVYLSMPKEQDVGAWLKETGWMRVADEERLLLVVGVPSGEWDLSGSREPDGDLAYWEALVSAPQQKYNLHSSRKYLAGYGDGANLAGMFTASTDMVNLFAGIALVDSTDTFGSFLNEVGAEEIVSRSPAVSVTEQKKNIPNAVLLINEKPLDERSPVVQYMIGCNAATERTEQDGAILYTNPENENQRVILAGSSVRDDNLSEQIWDRFLRKVRRWKSSPFGTLETGMSAVEMGLKELDVSTIRPLPDGYRLNKSWVYVPSTYDESSPVPLLIVCHGVNNNGEMMAEQTEWYKVAEKYGFIAAFPTGLSKLDGYPFWNVLPDGQSDPNGPDDVQFVCDLVDLMEKNYSIDETRVYMSGFSNGSMLGGTIMLEHPEQFAAFAGFSGNILNEVPAEKRANGVAIPIYQIFGEMDSMGWGDDARVDSWNHWAKQNGTLEPFPEEFTPDKENGRFMTQVFPGAKAEMRCTVVKEMPHATLPQEAVMAWEFCSRFSRMADGGIVDSKAGLSRAMMAQMLYDNTNKGDVESNIFSDVASGAWYEAPVSWAAASNVMSGYGDGRFGPNDELNREQLAVILRNYAAYLGDDVSVKADLSRFGDRAQISDWAEDAVAWAVGNGVIDCPGSTEFAPLEGVCQEDVSVILTQYFSN